MKSGKKLQKAALSILTLPLYCQRGKKGIDLKDFLFQELILKEKDFREKVDAIDTEKYKDAYVYIYNSVNTIIPLWAYFVLTAKITDVAKKVVFGNREDLEVILMHNAIQTHDFEEMRGKRVLVKGCSDKEIPENAYIELVEQLKAYCKISDVRRSVFKRSYH